MTERLRAIGAQYSRSVEDATAAEFRSPPFDDPEMVIDSYTITLETDESVWKSPADHPVCSSCPLYQSVTESHLPTNKAVICLGPDEVSEESTEGDMYNVEATVEIYEHASGVHHGNCGIVIDMNKELKKRVSWR